MAPGSQYAENTGEDYLYRFSSEKVVFRRIIATTQIHAVLHGAVRIALLASAEETSEAVSEEQR